MSHNYVTLFEETLPINNKEDKKYLHREVTFKEYDTGQAELFPEDLEQSVDKFHIARFIKAVISRIDISSIVSKYIGGGAIAYHPRLLLGIWLLAFSYRVHSCRGVAKLLRENIALKC